jgi:hypothetical protein
VTTSLLTGHDQAASKYMNKPEKTWVFSGFFIGLNHAGGFNAGDFALSGYGFSCQYCPVLLVSTFNIFDCCTRISEH